MRTLLRAAAIIAALSLGLNAVGLGAANAADEGTLSLKIVAPGGVAIPGATVEIQSDQDDHGISGISDAQGAFTSDKLAPGTYTALITFAPASWEPKVVLSTSKVTTVEAGELTHLTITMPGVQAVTGKVRASGLPVSRGTVRAFSNAGTFSTDIEHGGYVLFAKPGKYIMSASPVYPEISGWLTTYAGDTVRYDDTAKIAVSRSKPKVLNFAVFDQVGNITGYLRDANGDALAHRMVGITALNRGTQLNRQENYAYTDGTGRFTAGDLPAGKYQFEYNDPEYLETKVSKTVVVGKTSKISLLAKKRPEASGKVVVKLSAPRSIVKAGIACVRLIPKDSLAQEGGGCLPRNNKSKTVTLYNVRVGAYTTVVAGASNKKITVKKGSTTRVSLTRPAGVMISGKVRTSTGSPLRSVYISAYDKHGTWLGGVFTDRTGDYKLSGAVRGKYAITVVSHSPSQGATTVKSVTVGKKNTVVNIKLHKSATITGKVVNSKGEPVRNVLVSTTGGPTYDEVATNSKGVYTLRGLAPGTYRVITKDESNGGYFDGKSSKVKVAAGKKIALPTIKLTD